MKKLLSPVACGVLLGALGALSALGASPASAQTVIDQWNSIEAPPPPGLKPVQVDKSTALLLLDFNGAQDPTKGPCNSARAPRCIASLPKIKSLLDQAKAKGLLVVWSISPQAHSPSDIATSIAPGPKDPVVRSAADKFVNTKLADILAGHAIKTLIVTGTAAEGAVLDTSTDAVFRGYNIILPVDGMSSPNIYAEQYVTWHMANAPGVAAKTTLTRIDMIKF